MNCCNNIRNEKAMIMKNIYELGFALVETTGGKTGSRRAQPEADACAGALQCTASGSEAGERGAEGA